jgi:hypothetical protein
MDLMKIFDRLVGLSHDQERFEQERQEILLEDFSNAPAERRTMWLQLQNELNLLRLHLSPEQFRAELCRRMSDSLENMEDLFASMRVHLDDAHPLRPRQAELKLDAAR